MSNEINSSEFGLAVLILLVLSWLIFDGLKTGGVWVKGGRAEWGKWAHKKLVNEEPKFYWAAMGFYFLGSLFCVYMLIKDTL